MDSQNNDVEHDFPIRYMDRTRSYYLALGYNNPYEWAHYKQVPFTPLRKSLSRSKVALITTAAPYVEGAGDQGPGAPYNSAAKFYEVYALSIEGEPDVRISHVGIDRNHTTATDINSWFPLAQLKFRQAEGKIGELTSRFYGFPTNRSQNTTLHQDCPRLLQKVMEDGAEIAILAANCPVCHQCIAMAARYLESAGIPTVVIGCAKDIVEHVGVPRFLFNDFPLGNPAGKPHDSASQEATLTLALDLLETASSPRTTVQSPLKWSDNPHWKLDYCNVEKLSKAEIKARKKSFDDQKAIAKSRQESTRKND